MMQLICHAADLRFALPIHEVVEVVGRPTFDVIPAAPAWVAGAFVHRGIVTPVIDVAVLAGVGQSRSLWSSRVIVLEHPVANQRHRVGLLFDRAHAEQVPEQKSAPDHQAASVQIWPWGKTLIDEHGTYCQLDVNAVLSQDRQAQLFPGTQ